MIFLLFPCFLLYLIQLYDHVIFFLIIFSYSCFNFFHNTLMEKYMFHINWYRVPYYQYSLWRPYFLGFTKINFKHITRRVATLSFTRQIHMKSIKPLYGSYFYSEAFSAATIRFKKAFRIHPLYPMFSTPKMHQFFIIIVKCLFTPKWLPNTRNYNIK